MDVITNGEFFMNSPSKGKMMMERSTYFDVCVDGKIVRV